MDNTQIYWLHSLSPTHVGTGRGVGYIDLPIHRDKVTNWPMIPGSAFKGVWADHYGATEKARREDSEAGRKLRFAFGRASDDGDSNAGALIPSDARLVCLPIRSFQGTFAWCTSPLALKMLHRDLRLAGMADLPPDPPQVSGGAVHLTASSKLADGNRVFLEDLNFTGKECAATSAWAERLAGWVFPDDETWRDLFIERFAVLPDAAFDFLTETGTEVSTRVRIDDDLKTVAQGQLWNEEALPPETILSGFVTCDRIYSRETHGISAGDLIKDFATRSLTLQIGGKATVGRGRVRCVFTPAQSGG